MDIQKLTNKQKVKIFDTLLTHAKTMSEGKAINLMGSKKAYLTAQLNALHFLDVVKLTIDKINEVKTK